MNTPMLRCFMTAAALLAAAPVQAADSKWQEEFGITSCTLQTTGRNQYFVLEPGFQLVLEGDGARVQITVLDETKVVGGVTTRVVEEREWKKRGGEAERELVHAGDRRRHNQ